MMRRSRLIPAMGVVAMVLIAASTTAMAGGTRSHESGESEKSEKPEKSEDRDDRKRNRCRIDKGEPVEIAVAKLIIEFNATDGDLGVHGQFDDTGWSRLCVLDPDGRRILDVDPKRQLDDLTMASLFFESREPPLTEFGFDDLAAKFDEGIYQVFGESYDGTLLTGEALFSHDVPAMPVITAPEVADDEESAAAVIVPTSDLVIGWEPVTETVAGGPVTITGYEVIVTKVEHDDPNGFSRPTYDVHIGPDATSLAVPSDFVEADTLYEVEVLALEVTGNQTIGVGFFTTGA